MARSSFFRALLALALTVGSAAAASGGEAQIIPVEPYNGAFVVPIVLNGVLTKKFIVDSGSADVSIPADVASALKNLGTLTEADLLGSKTYMLADGSKSSSQIYRVASLRIGDMVMKDVTVRVAAAKSDLLLGQSFLSRLQSWSMDNARRVMIIN